MITMIDYGGSNIRSVQKAFEFVGAEVSVTSSPQDAARAGKLVLPGVGAFGAGMSALRARKLDQAILEAVDRGAALLGICLGMQFLLQESDEMGRHAGLGLLPGRVTRFAKDVRDSSGGGQLKVPHVGWNQIEFAEDHPLLAGVASGSHVYFVHSYYCEPAVEADIITRTSYGIEFASIVGRDRVFGIQFHPEKSQAHGLAIIRNFCQLQASA